MNRGHSIARVCLLVSSSLLGCGGSTASGEPPSAPAVTGAGERPSWTAKQCHASGGGVVGDIGDGATQRPDYVCPSGAAPSATIVAESGGPIGVEGAVCCPKRS